MNSKLAKGDCEAFAQLYDQMANQLYHYLIQQTGSPEDSADLLHDTFLRLYRKRTHFESVENIPAYVFQVVRNELLRWCSKNKRRIVTSSLLVEELPANVQPSQELEAQIVEALIKIDDRFREVIELKIFAKFTFAEIALIIGSPQGTVATWYRRGIEQMRIHLND